MTDANSAAAATPAAAATFSGQPLSLPGWSSPGQDRLVERERLIDQARGTDAARQLQRCFPRWMKAFDHLAWRALVRLAANEPVDPNDPDMWASRDEQAQAVLRRHGLTTVRASRLTLPAVNRLIDGQAAADRDAELDWSTLTVPASRLDEPLRRAHARLPIDLNDPTVYIHRDDQRRVLAGRLGLAADKADDLSRWSLAYPDDFDPQDLRCWRIGSTTWLALADEQLETVERVQRPVGLFVAPAIRTEDWQLSPVLSLEAIRLIEMLGGQVDRDLCAATLPFDRVPTLLERINPQTLHAGPKECLDSAGQLASELSTKLGQRVSPGVPRDKRDRWGRLVVSRTGYTGNDGTRRSELRLRVVTFPTRDFTQRRLGARRMSETYNAQVSAAMDLGEAVQTAVDRGLPLLLSTEAAGHLKDKIRVGRMKGRPGALTITTSDGLSATTRRLVAEQAIAELRALKRAGAKVTLDAGARQMVRMTAARPLEDDPVLLGRQKEIAALKVVGSGVDASQTGAGKCVAAETRVLVNGRWLSAAEVWARYASGRRWMDEDGEWADPNQLLWTTSLDDHGRLTYGRISALYRQRVRETGRRVRLVDGSDITATLAHRLHTADAWSRDIHAGDLVAVPARIKWHGTDPDPAVVELLAWQIAEGYESPTRPIAGTAYIFQKDESVLRRLHDVASDIEDRLGIRMGKLSITPYSERTSKIQVGSRYWRRYVEGLGYRWGRRAGAKEIPEAIVAAGDETLRLFLRCFFDAEGSVGSERRTIELTSASQALMWQLSLMLRRFGIWMRVKQRQKAATNGSRIRRAYWTGYISGPSIRRFSEEIGSGHQLKLARLGMACAGSSNPNVELVPVRDICDGLRASGVPGRWMLPEGCEILRAAGVARSAALAVADAIELVPHRAATRRGGAVSTMQRADVLHLPASTFTDAAERLRNRASRDVLYVKVKQVEPVELDGWVYDFSAEEHQNYVAGGMLVHNTTTTGRALANRAATTQRFRAMVIAEGRLLGQWRDELAKGAPGRGLPPLAPNVELLALDDQRQIAGQLRAFDRELLPAVDQRDARRPARAVSVRHGRDRNRPAGVRGAARVQPGPGRQRRHRHPRRLALPVPGHARGDLELGGAGQAGRPGAAGRGRRPAGRTADVRRGRARVDAAVSRPGAGRRSLTESDPELLGALEVLVDPDTRGDPQSPLRWCSKSLGKIAGALVAGGHQVSDRSVGKLLRGLGFRLHANQKTREGKDHPDRDAQFRHISETARAALQAGEPTISVDAKKRELVGDFKAVGREYEPTGRPVEVRCHDFKDKDLGHAIPYGVYDLKANEGMVSVGVTNETSAFAVNSIRAWWQHLGRKRYPDAKTLTITADGGGSNSSRTRLWKTELQKLANELGIPIRVCHFPPGTSKWNKIEHRMFSYVSLNWRGRPLESLQVIIDLIGATTTSTGLKVYARLDPGKYEKGIKVSDAELAAVNIVRDEFHPDWNYTIYPTPIPAVILS